MSNPHPVGTNEYYLHEAQSDGFNSVYEWAIWHKQNNPICRYCRTPQGFAPGTGDCDCEGEPGVERFIPNPNRTL